MGSGLETLLRRHPLRRLLAVGFAVGLLLAVVGLGTLVYAQVSAYVWRASELRLRDEAEAAVLRQAPAGTSLADLRRRPGTLVAPDDLASAAPQIARDLRARDVAVWVLDADGRVLAHGPAQPDGPEVEPRVVVALRNRLARNLAVGVAFPLGNDRGDFQVLLVPLLRNDQVAGVIQLATPLAPAQALLARLRLVLLLGALAVILVGGGLAYWLAWALTTPLERVADTAGRIAAGDLRRRVGLPPGENEVYRTARAFDMMVGRLEMILDAQRRFVADASHELKSPLTAIGGMVEMLRLGADRADAAARQRMLAAVEREVDRMGRLVRDLLLLSRAEEGHLAARRPLDLAEVARQAAAVAGQAHPGQAVELELAGPLPTTGDADLLERTLLNLLDNAAQHSPSGSAITISGRRDGSRVVLAVRDRGAGIPAADLPRVFDRFYRADPSRARQTGGSGLGLAIVRSAVEAHGGTVGIESREGEGTTVTIRLPATESAESAEAPAPPPAEASGTLQPAEPGP